MDELAAKRAERRSHPYATRDKGKKEVTIHEPPVISERVVEPSEVTISGPSRITEVTEIDEGRWLKKGKGPEIELPERPKPSEKNPVESYYREMKKRGTGPEAEVTPEPKPPDKRVVDEVVSRTQDNDIEMTAVDEDPLEKEERLFRKNKKKLKKSDYRKLTNSVEYDGSLDVGPQQIRMTAMKKPFDVMEFFRQVKMDTLSLADLMYVSPYLRKKVTWGLRTLPKPRQDSLMRLFGLPEDYVENPARHLYTFKRTLELSKWSIHQLTGTIAGSPVRGMLDGGACVNCVSMAFVERLRLPLQPRSTNLSFKQVDGAPARVRGEINEVCFDIKHVAIPFSALVITDMDGDLLLGRPFLEKTKAVADYATGRFFLQWQNRLVVAEATTTEEPIVMDMEHPVTTYMKEWDKFLERINKPKIDEWLSSATEGEETEYDTGDEDEDDDPFGIYGNDEPSVRGMRIEAEMRGGNKRIMRLEPSQYISREEFDQMLDNDEVAYASLLKPGGILSNEDDEMLNIARLMGVRTDDGGDGTPSIPMRREISSSEDESKKKESDWSPVFGLIAKVSGYPCDMNPEPSRPLL